MMKSLYLDYNDAFSKLDKQISPHFSKNISNVNLTHPYLDIKTSKEPKRLLHQIAPGQNSKSNMFSPFYLWSQEKRKSSKLRQDMMKNRQLIKQVNKYSTDFFGDLWRVKEQIQNVSKNSTTQQKEKRKRCRPPYFPIILNSKQIFSESEEKKDTKEKLNKVAKCLHSYKVMNKIKEDDNRMFWVMNHFQQANKQSPITTSTKQTLDEQNQQIELNFLQINMISDVEPNVKLEPFFQEEGKKQKTEQEKEPITNQKTEQKLGLELIFDEIKMQKLACRKIKQQLDKRLFINTNLLEEGQVSFQQKSIKTQKFSLSELYKNKILEIQVSQQNSNINRNQSCNQNSNQNSLLFKNSVDKVIPSLKTKNIKRKWKRRNRRRRNMIKSAQVIPHMQKSQNKINLQKRQTSLKRNRQIDQDEYQIQMREGRKIFHTDQRYNEIIK